MSCKLYVGNLSHSTREDDLWKLFSQSGTVVLIDLIKDRVSGRSQGYAFIEMSNLPEAEKAIEMFNGRRLDNNQIRVSLARRRDGLVANGNNQSVSALKRGKNKPYEQAKLKRST
jgi:RNA recognition motif-containing protein